MSGFQPSAALLRTRIMSRPSRADDHLFESGQRTKPATKAFERQGAARAAERVIRQSRRSTMTSDQRSKEIERRRRWAGGGNMPPDIRSSYSEAERAALSVIAETCRKKGACDMCLEEIARLAGVSRTTVQNAIRKARSKASGHLSVRERPQQFGKNLTNVIKIVSKSWVRWMMRSIGFKRLNTSETTVKNSLFQQEENAKTAFEKECERLLRNPSNRPDQMHPSPQGKPFDWWRASTCAHG